ncbi:MAG: hypothetical protein QM698_01040 [Micropepsaceae bacterium]
MKALAAVFALALVAPAAASEEADAFFGEIAALCGQAFEGRVVTTDARDKDMASARLVMHVRECEGDRLAIPFHVGEDRSRTWRITRTEAGLRLKHDHRHEDGTPDAVTMYGGDTATPGAATRQDFPADEETKQVFRANKLEASLTNVWGIEIEPGKIFAYELNRADRHFRIEFDLTRPVTPPPPPWGEE